MHKLPICDCYKTVSMPLCQYRSLGLLIIILSSLWIGKCTETNCETTMHWINNNYTWAEITGLRSHIYKRGLKAYFKLIRTLNPLPKPSMSLYLFYHLVKPILLYGCEIWTPIDLKYNQNKNLQSTAKMILLHNYVIISQHIAKYFDKIDPIEKLHLKFCKSILDVHSKATNLALYSKLGRYPLFVDRIVASM